MLGMKICINNEPPIIAADDNLGVLSVNLAATGELGDGARILRQGALEANEAVNLHLHAGGLTSRSDGNDEHLRWIQHYKLKVGDCVIVEIVETDVASMIVSREPAKRNSPTSSERAMYEHVKEMYFQMRDKFEGENSGSNVK
jgi:hypothetical protein